MTKSEPRILIVDDNPDFCELLRVYLSQHGYQLRFAFDGQMGWEQIQEDAPDLVVLDVTMPVMNGLELCWKIRSSSTVMNLPVLFTSVLHEIEDKAQAFLIQGDDYLPKPFNPRELHLRIEAVLRRSRHQYSQGGGELVHYKDERVCIVPGMSVPIHLTKQENAVLGYLMERPLQPVAATSFMNEALEQLVDGSYLDTTAARKVILQLRRKIEPNPKEPRFIRTVHQFGYILVPHGGTIDIDRDLRINVQDTA